MSDHGHVVHPEQPSPEPAERAGPSTLRLAASGVLVGLLGVLVSQLVTTLVTERASPVYAVAEVILRKTPGGVAEALISVVGTLDKPLLITGTVLGLLALSAVAGVLARRSSLLPVLLFLAMGGVALLAVMSGRGSGVSRLLPVFAGVVTWLLAHSFLIERGVVRASRTHADDPALARRSFLVRAGAVVLVGGVVGVAGGALAKSRDSVARTRQLLRLNAKRGDVPAGAEIGVAGISPWRTPNADFYRIDTALLLPNVDPASWSLRIHGLVDREIRLSYEDLLKREMTEAWVTICCVSNEVGGELIGNAHWSGVRIADLLAEAGPQPGADAVQQTSADGWTCGTPLSALTDDRNAILAVAMNGDPLPVEHGFPVRVIVPGLYGYVSATKWVTDLEVTRYTDFSAYWTQRGWSARGPVKTESRIDLPEPGSSVPAGRVRLGGVAWAQHTGIAEVEVRLDGGAWQQAELGAHENDDSWVQWSVTVDLQPGSHTAAVRATDRSGYTQTPVRVDPVPDGATGWHMIDFGVDA